MRVVECERERRTDVRRRRRLARDRGKSWSGCAPRSNRPARRASAPSPAPPARRPAPARRLDRLDRDEARRRPAARGAARLRRRTWQPCINDVITCGADPLILLDYVAASRLELEQVAELVEGRRGLPRRRGRAGRRRDGRAAGRLPRGRARLRRHLRRDRRARPADRRLGRRRWGLRRRAALGGRARERLHARPLGARARGLRRPGLAGADAALSTTSGACAAAHTPSRT